MIAASQIVDLLNSSEDYDYTERLMSRFEKLKAERKPFFLESKDLDEILKWKLRGCFAEQQLLRSANSEEIIRSITGLALTIKHDDKEYELELRLRILTSLRGVDIAIASAILALVYPQDYGVIDHRGWHNVFWESETAFSILEYKRFLHEIRRLAKELKWPALHVNLAIWEYDRLNAKNSA